MGGDAGTLLPSKTTYPAVIHVKIWLPYFTYFTQQIKKRVFVYCDDLDQVQGAVCAFPLMGTR
jgi:hypothetical protein